MDSIISIHNISKQYSVSKNSCTQVLNGISLEVCRGEFLVIMGPSGSGKSTLLYNMTGLETPDSGEVFFSNKSLTSLNDKELARLRLLNIGFVFQQSYLNSNLSLLDNILLPAYLSRKMPRAEARVIAQHLMCRFGIEQVANHGIAEVSGGQLQRAAICRALINDPELIVGDEPTGALNSSNAVKILDLLNEINKQGRTILIATHDAKVAERADRVIYIRDGNIISEYKPDKKGSYGTEDVSDRGLLSWLAKMGF